ncbi:MAG: BadF/BadG/BcrA/BcrD ATPase family protein [Armatimonadota bacterium]|nr:BadF/BadG/BcrA/BcrD ATPase family protein [Armatimonadota bacterium]
MGVVVGIEGGGTKTGCAVLNEQGEVLAYAEGGPANLNFVDEATQRQSFETAIRGAMAGIQAPVRAVGYSVAGSRANWEWVLGLLGNPPAYPIEESRMAMLSTGVEKAHGIAVIAGTGSLVAGFKNDQLVKQVGGWGALLGDEGSAYDVAMRALRCAVRAWDGRDRPTALVEAAQRFFGIQDLSELVPLFYQRGVPRHTVAAFAKVVVETARQGDLRARLILIRAGFELANDACACAKAVFQRDEEFSVALTGGMFKSKLFRVAFQEYFAMFFPHAAFLRPVMEPAVAVARAVLRQLAS